MAKFFVVDGMRSLVGCAKLVQMEDNYPAIGWLAAEPLRLVSDFVRHQASVNREVLIRANSSRLTVVTGSETPYRTIFVRDEITGAYERFRADTAFFPTHIGAGDDREGLLMEARARVGVGFNSIAIVEECDDGEYVATLLTAGGHLLSQEEVDFRQELREKAVSQPSPEVVLAPAPIARVEEDDEEV